MKNKLTLVREENGLQYLGELSHFDNDTCVTKLTNVLIFDENSEIMYEVLLDEVYVTRTISVWNMESKIKQIQTSILDGDYDGPRNLYPKCEQMLLMYIDIAELE